MVDFMKKQGISCNKPHLWKERQQRQWHKKQRTMAKSSACSWDSHWSPGFPLFRLGACGAKKTKTTWGVFLVWLVVEPPLWKKYIQATNQSSNLETYVFSVFLFEILCHRFCMNQIPLSSFATNTWDYSWVESYKREPQFSMGILTAGVLTVMFMKQPGD